MMPRVELEAVDPDDPARMQVFRNMMTAYLLATADEADPEQKYHVSGDLTNDDRSELAILTERYGARCMFLATVHGRAVGAVALRRRSPDAVELCRLWVDPAHRRHGVGSLLTTWMVDEAARRGMTSVLLTVLEGRDTAAAMYERLGFKLIGHKEVGPVRLRRYERTLGTAS